MRLICRHDQRQFIDLLEGCRLFGYFGYHSAGVKPAWAKMVDHSTNREWRAIMGPMQVSFQSRERRK
jgi:L-rhamnose mutarotase